MGNSEYLSLLHQHDDPKHWEWPGGWNAEAYRTAERKFRDFGAGLEKTLRENCTIESGTLVQDASFLGQIILPRMCFVSDERVPIRVSNFGSFATVYGNEEAFRPEVLDKIKSTMRNHDYIYIPPLILEQAYTGLNPGVTGVDNWGIRYFDWV